MNDKVYFLCGSEFTALIRRGRLISMKHTGDSLGTEYVDEKEGFGAITLACRPAGSEEVNEFCLDECEDFTESAPAWEKEALCYRAEGSCGPLRTALAYSLEGGRLQMRLTLTNQAGTPTEVTDLGFRFCANTDFAWGKDASPNVIGHHYVGGHGSHSSWYRVDGNGYALVFAPEAGSTLTFYDHFPWIDREAHKKPGEEHPGKGVTMLYPFAALRGARAEEKGAALRIPQEALLLEAGQSVTFSYRFFWADSMDVLGEALVQNGLVNAIALPGFTVPMGHEIALYLDSEADDIFPDFDDGCMVTELVQAGHGLIVRFTFTSLGEHTVRAVWNKEAYQTDFYFFATEDIDVLWEKRAAFIADKQEKDADKWYRGLFCEWNNETGVRLSPDNYDRIGGWRIYEVSCDDPGLSKPAFLSSKQTVLPRQEEVDALDDYIEHFVWGGLQQTREEAYPFGIYGIPDWKKLRDSDDHGIKGRLHIWRIYDYSHIALMYYNMYRVARDYPQVSTRLPAEEYLLRACGTACAMFTIPVELDDWNAVKTGLYNERVIPRIIEALREEGKQKEADRLQTFWMRKVRFFVTECKDVFGSEYPFDTTGFESTYYLAEDALKAASFTKDDSPWASDIPLDKAIAFMEKQHRCNLACRGWWEPAYFWYGSDYRGNNTHYLLSYMSQMGGCSILDHALYHEEEPWAMLRLGYGSLLSSYALMNTGTEESGYGYWFPGKEHDGAAGGGFEPLYETSTWLDQPSHGGSWYYSCEIDLGFCGGLRGACTVLANDPLFGWTVFGGRLMKGEISTRTRDVENLWVRTRDGARRRFHFLSGRMRFHAKLKNAAFSTGRAAGVKADGSCIILFLDKDFPAEEGKLTIETRYMGTWTATAGGETLDVAENGEIVIPKDCGRIEIRFDREG